MDYYNIVKLLCFVAAVRKKSKSQLQPKII